LSHKLILDNNLAILGGTFYHYDREDIVNGSEFFTTVGETRPEALIEQATRILRACKNEGERCDFVCYVLDRIKEVHE
jgi:hypothetical protein